MRGCFLVASLKATRSVCSTNNLCRFEPTRRNERQGWALIRKSLKFLPGNHISSLVAGYGNYHQIAVQPPSRSVCVVIFVGRGTARAEDAQEKPNQSHISPRLLVYEDKFHRFYQGSKRHEGGRVRLPSAQRPLQCVLVHQILQQNHLASGLGVMVWGLGLEVWGRGSKLQGVRVWCTMWGEAGVRDGVGSKPFRGKVRHGFSMVRDLTTDLVSWFHFFQDHLCEAPCSLHEHVLTSQQRVEGGDELVVHHLYRDTSRHKKQQPPRILQ